MTSPLPLTNDNYGKFLGLVNFYRRFIPQCALILHPLNSLLSPSQKDVYWTSQAREIFTNIKEALATVTLLFHPLKDVPLSIMADASNVAIGAVLQQSVDGHYQPISYFSRKLSSTESHYSTFDWELLAVCAAIRHFKHYVEGCKFTIFTDHKPLTYSLFSHSDRYSPRQVHHLDYISQFTSDIRHVTGSDNPVADALSRININAIHQLPNGWSSDLWPWIMPTPNIIHHWTDVYPCPTWGY